MNTETNPDAILRRPAVEALCGMSRSSMYAAMSRGEFPRPVKLGSRAVGWRLGDVQKWLQSRPQAGE